jgi:putative membrane protein insertion efficiency factor
MIGELFIFIIKLYKKFISPLLPHSCRYYPTCSSYAVLSIEKYGAFKGSLKAIYRILRCNPFSRGGIDYP